MSDTTLWGTSLPPEVEPEPAPEQSVNPCIDMYGKGPEGRICRDCVHLHGFQQSATWYKCEKRKWKAKSGKNQGTIYPGGDHRVRWPSCAKFKEREYREC
jgi:hypothetical protein